MIQINRNHRVDLDKLAECHYDYFERKFAQKLKRLLSDEEDSEFKGYLEFLELRKREILIGKPKQLHDILEEMKEKHAPIFTGIKEYADGKDLTNRDTVACWIHKIRQVFNYNQFCRSTLDSSWGTYQLAERLQVSVCPYCNRQYTTTLHLRGKKVTRPDFDHFYNKAYYPYFALSFYNLIPCCGNCNSKLKRKNDFTYATHIHPYCEGFEDRLVFSVKFKRGEKTNYLGILNHDMSTFTITLDKNHHLVDVDEEFLDKANANKKIFRLEDLYNHSHKDYVSEMIYKAELYSEDYLNSLHEMFPDLFQHRQGLLQIITGNFVELDDLDKRVLAKLTRDIAKEFGLLGSGG